MSLERTMRDLWPEDPRWGEAILKPPVGGVETAEYREQLDRVVNAAKALVQRFTDKYPDNPWWTTEFVEAHPPVALLLQSVNEELIFPSMHSLIDLSNRVAMANEVPFIDRTSPAEVQAGRIALSTMWQSDDGGSELLLAHTVMTPRDRLEFVLLLNGQGRYSPDA